MLYRCVHIALLPWWSPTLCLFVSRSIEFCQINFIHLKASFGSFDTLVRHSNLLSLSLAICDESRKDWGSCVREKLTSWSWIASAWKKNGIASLSPCYLINSRTKTLFIVQQDTSAAYCCDTVLLSRITKTRNWFGFDEIGRIIATMWCAHRLASSPREEA